MIKCACKAVDKIAVGLNFLSPVIDLVIRFWVAQIFFKAGLTKISSWETTIALFEDEYKVPILSPQIAALLGTTAELTLPLLLVFGLATRFSAAALFIFNIVAVVSYPGLSEVGLEHHKYWGLLLLIPLFHGPGKLSIDYLISKKCALYKI